MYLLDSFCLISYEEHKRGNKLDDITFLDEDLPAKW